MSSSSALVSAFAAALAAGLALGTAVRWLLARRLLGEAATPARVIAGGLLDGTVAVMLVAALVITGSASAASMAWVAVVYLVMGGLLNLALLGEAVGQRFWAAFVLTLPVPLATLAAAILIGRGLAFGATGG